MEWTVLDIKLYNRNDCCPERLQGIELYFGYSWDNYWSNPMICPKIGCPGNDPPFAIDVPGDKPLRFDLYEIGRYLWVVKPGSRMTLCEVEVNVMRQVKLVDFTQIDFEDRVRASGGLGHPDARRKPLDGNLAI